jgi:HemY protein
VLLHEKSRTAEAAGATREALEHAAKAHKLDPAFAPATVRYADLLRAGGKRRPAAKAIESGWRAQPHPALAEAYGALFAEEPPVQRLKHVEQLAGHNPGHRESRLALAGAALAARLWGEARRHLEAAGAAPSGDATPPTPRVCRLMAELEQAERDNHGAARAWLARATATSSLDETYICDACGSESGGWTPLCPHCRGFDSLRWRAPGGTAAPRLAASDGFMPALPVPAPWPSPGSRQDGPAPMRAVAAVDVTGPRM